MFDPTKLPAAPARRAATLQSTGGAPTDMQAQDADSGRTPVPSYPARNLVLKAGRYVVAELSK